MGDKPTNDARCVAIAKVQMLVAFMSQYILAGQKSRCNSRSTIGVSIIIFCWYDFGRRLMG